LAGYQERRSFRNALTAFADIFGYRGETRINAIVTYLMELAVSILKSKQNLSTELRVD